MRSIAVYLVQLAYGGPEEGGWYYQAGELCTDPELTAFGTTFTRCFMIGLLAQAQPIRRGMMWRS